MLKRILGLFLLSIFPFSIFSSFSHTFIVFFDGLWLIKAVNERVEEIKQKCLSSLPWLKVLFAYE